MDINLTLQLDMLRTVEIFAKFAEEIEHLSGYLSPQMYLTLVRTWSEAIEISFVNTIKNYYGDWTNV